MYSQYQQYNQGSSRQYNQGSSRAQTIPPNPVQTYTKYYHAWTKRHAELSRFNSRTSEDDSQWAKYYAEESSRAAHHFYENPQATSVPFPLPPAPPSATTGSLPATAATRRTRPSNSSVTRYVNRNMQRRELENDPHLKRRVQAEIEAQIARAIGNGSFQSKNWDALPLISFNSHATGAASSRLESVLEERIIEEVKDISELQERLKRKNGRYKPRLNKSRHKQGHGSITPAMISATLLVVLQQLPLLYPNLKMSAL